MKQLNLSTPHLLIVAGLPGSGKTQFASKFAETFSSPYLDVAPLQAQLRDDVDADSLIDGLVEQMLRSQRTVVVEPATGSRTTRHELAKLARSHGYQPLTIWVQTNATVAKTRATTGSQRKPAAYTADEYDKAARYFTAPIPSEATCVISGMHTQPSQIRVVLKRLGDASGRKSSSLDTKARASAGERRPRLIQ